MKKLLQGESGSRGTVIDVKSKLAVVTHCWKQSKDSTRYQLEYKYSFDVEIEEVYRLAALWVNKDFQNRMRVEKHNEKELTAQEGEVISVKKMYEKRERAAKDPVKAAASAFGKISDAERAAMFAEYQKSLEAAE